MATLHIYEFAATWICMNNRLRFGSSGCLIWTGNTCLKALLPLIWIIPVLDKLYGIASFYRAKYKKGCSNWSCSHMVPVRAWKIIIAIKYWKRHYYKLICRKVAHSPCFVTFWRHNVFGIFWILLNFEPIILPVNGDFLLDWVSFIMEPLRVSVHVWVTQIWWNFVENLRKRWVIKNMHNRLDMLFVVADFIRDHFARSDL